MRKLSKKEVRIIRVIMNLISIVGVLLLGRLIYHANTGELAHEMQQEFTNMHITTLKALFIALPVSLHVIAIGLILQKRWLSKVWKRIAWFAIVVSGMWLGVALMIKIFVK